MGDEVGGSINQHGCSSRSLFSFILKHYVSRLHFRSYFLARALLVVGSWLSRCAPWYGPASPRTSTFLLDERIGANWHCSTIQFEAGVLLDEATWVEIWSAVFEWVCSEDCDSSRKPFFFRWFWYWSYPPQFRFRLETPPGSVTVLTSGQDGFIFVFFFSKEKATKIMQDFHCWIPIVKEAISGVFWAQAKMFDFRPEWLDFPFFFF